MASASSTEATGSAKPAFFEPASERAAEPAARRSASASYESSFSGTGPSPAAMTTGTFRPSGAGSLVSSPSAPEAPRATRTAASFPPNALSTASAPGARTRSPDLEPVALATPTTSASARSVAAPAVLRVRAVTVVKSRFR